MQKHTKGAVNFSRPQLNLRGRSARRQNARRYHRPSSGLYRYQYFLPLLQPRSRFHKLPCHLFQSVDGALLGRRQIECEQDDFIGTRVKVAL